MKTPPGMNAVKRACDACHRRKVKCIGSQDGKSCRNCSQASLSCTFNAVPQKKGPKGSRAKVISELRETQRQSALAVKIQNHLDGAQSPPGSPNLSPTPGLLTPTMIQNCIDFFFTHMYPTMPILHRERLQLQAQEVNHSIETYCLVSSLCAFMMIQSGMRMAGSTIGEQSKSANSESGKKLLEEALRVRKGYDFVENPTLATVTTSFFIFGCYFGMDRHNTAWFHLREATTLAQTMGMHQEATYTKGDIIETSRRRRLYWLLFLTERAYALQRHHPLTLHCTIDMPTVDEDPTETVAISGFIHLVNLFRPFDDTFVGLWNKSRSDCSTAWLKQLQQQLSDALPADLNATESQAADLRTSQLWLRTMVWQLSISNGYLSSSSADSSMTFKYPIEIARDLTAVTSSLSKQAMEVHGIGLIEKFFDIGCTLIDVMACVPLENPGFEIGPRDYLEQFISLISTLRGGDSRFLPLLLAKVNDAFPALASPVSQSLSLEPAHRRLEEVFEHSSAVSSPYDSPPMVSTGPPEYTALTANVIPFAPLPVGVRSMNFSAPIATSSPTSGTLSINHGMPSGVNQYQGYFTPAQQDDYSS